MIVSDHIIKTVKDWGNGVSRRYKYGKGINIKTETSKVFTRKRRNWKITHDWSRRKIKPLL